MKKKTDQMVWWKSGALVMVAVVSFFGVAACSDGEGTIQDAQIDEAADSTSTDSGGSVDVIKSQIDDLEKKIADLQEEYAKRLEELTEGLDSKDVVAADDPALAEIQKQLDELKAQHEKELAALQEQLDDANADLKIANEAALNEKAGREEAEDEAARAQAELDELKNQSEESANSGGDTPVVSTNLESDGLLIKTNFLWLDDVDNKDGITHKTSWVSIFLYKEQPDYLVPENPENTATYMGQLRASAAAKAVAFVDYAGSDCWDESNQGKKGNNIENCRKEIWMTILDKNANVAEIKYARLIAHDTHGDDFDFNFSTISLRSKGLVATMTNSDPITVYHNYKHKDFGPLEWKPTNAAQ